MHVGNGCRRLTALELGEMHLVSRDALQVRVCSVCVSVIVCIVCLSCLFWFSWSGWLVGWLVVRWLPACSLCLFGGLTHTPPECDANQDASHGVLHYPPPNTHGPNSTATPHLQNNINNPFYSSSTLSPKTETQPNHTLPTTKQLDQVLFSTPECARGLEEASLARSDVDDDVILALAMTSGNSLTKLDVNGGGAFLRLRYVLDAFGCAPRMCACVSVRTWECMHV